MTAHRCIYCAEPSLFTVCSECVHKNTADAFHERMRELEEVKLLCGVPKNLITARLDEDDPVVYPMDPGIFLHGLPGRGKSYIAAALVHERLVMLAKLTPPECVYFLGVGWWSAPGLYQRISRNIHEQDMPEEEAARLAGSTKFLVLDDLGSEKMSEWRAQTLLNVLSLRESLNLPTIITSQYTLKDLEHMYGHVGEAITSRIEALCAKHRVTGPDRRRRAVRGN